MLAADIPCGADVTNISGLTVANNPAGIIINNLGTLTINPETGALTYRRVRTSRGSIPVNSST